MYYLASIPLLIGVTYLFLKKTYPNKICNIRNNIVWQILKLYSNCKFYLTKLKFKYAKKKIIFIEDSCELLKLTINDLEEIKELKSRIEEDIDYNFIFFVNNNDYIRYNNIDELIENNFDYNSSSIQFINISLDYNDIKYNINLKKNNFYIENNILFDKEFMKYYCKKNLKLNYDENINYTITILDNDCNKIDIKNDSYIIINKDTYTINKCIINKNNKNTEIEDDSIDMCSDIETKNIPTSSHWFFDYLKSK